MTLFYHSIEAVIFCSVFYMPLLLHMFDLLNHVFRTFPYCLLWRTRFMKCATAKWAKWAEFGPLFNNRISFLPEHISSFHFQQLQKNQRKILQDISRILFEEQADVQSDYSYFYVLSSARTGTGLLAVVIHNLFFFFWLSGMWLNICDMVRLSCFSRLTPSALHMLD